MVKAGVIEEFVTPLLKHLERIDREANAYKDRDPDIIDMFKFVHREVEIAKIVLSAAYNWENKLVEAFGTIERHLDCMLDDNGSQITTELKAVLEKIVKISEMMKPLKELPDAQTPILHSEEPNLEIGESSETKIVKEGDETDENHYSSDWEKIMKLSPNLAFCSFSLFLFPENFKLKKRLLINWWIGLGLVQAKGTETAEDIGQSFFIDLVSLGILTPFKGTKTGDVDGYIIESKVYWQLVAEAKRRNFIPDVSYNAGGSSHFFDCVVQTICSKFSTLINIDETYLKSDYLLEWILAKENNDPCIMQLGQRIMESRHIEVNKTDFLKYLKPGLTYLSLQGISRITELPDSIGNLENLIVLDLQACHNLEKLPSKIKSMNKLTHLDVSKCYLLDYLPKWVGLLSNLEVLKGFVIGNSKNRDRCRLTDLANLGKLRKLSMTIGRESEVEPQGLQNFKKLTHLRSLTIIWGTGRCNETGVVISLPENLEKLDIRCYPQDVMSKWFDKDGLKNLKRLYIRGGKLEKLENNIATIKILRLRFLRNFEMLSVDLYSLFPNLDVLESVKCNKMQKMNTADGLVDKGE